MISHPSLCEQVRSKASGHCEYYLLNETDAGLPHDIDHVLSRKHGGSDEIGNLAFACFLCNRYKGTDIASLRPGTGQLVRLFHPRADSWRDHFRIRGPIIYPCTETATVTAMLLRFNIADRVIERRSLQALNRFPKE